ncbi:MAG: hypothetical protein JST48_13870 [Bacteroidetes bacterium]|nr:hypothetical protein [Bacteroidota bacterium]
MVNFTVKKIQPYVPKADANFYQRSFALALINWEINRQEDRLNVPKVARRKNS